MRTVRVFMNVFARTTRAGEMRYHSEWWTRGTTSLMYRSTACDNSEHAAELALNWLARMNREPDRATHYVDTTPQPERFGYSHNPTESTEVQP